MYEKPEKHPELGAIIKWLSEYFMDVYTYKTNKENIKTPLATKPLKYC